MLNLWGLAAVLILAGTVTAVLTCVVRRYAISQSLFDIPNARSSHEVPTPRGGGVAMVLVFFALSTLLAPWVGVPIEALVAVLGGGVLVAAVGYRDDHGDVPARWRLLAHFVAAALALGALGGLPPLPFGGWALDMGLLGYAVGAIFVVWLLNLYNFMDGIDGIAGVELVTVAVGAALLLLWSGEAVAAGWLLLLAACGLGFLVWNWPPAKIFMGDAGSGFLGFVLAAFAIWTGGADGIGLWAWLILLGAFLVDATWTLIRRVLHGQKFYEAHRIHAYQYAARRYGAHKPVTVAVGLINLFWLLPLAALAAWQPEWGILLLLIAYTPLVYLCWHFNAGVPEGKPGNARVV